MPPRQAIKKETPRHICNTKVQRTIMCKLYKNSKIFKVSNISFFSVFSFSSYFFFIDFSLLLSFINHVIYSCWIHVCPVESCKQQDQYVHDFKNILFWSRVGLKLFGCWGLFASPLGNSLLILIIKLIHFAKKHE